MSISDANDPGNDCPAPGNVDNQRLPLLQHHLADLRRSGLSDGTIRAAGIYSEVEPDEIARILDHDKARRSLAPAIVFPFRNRRGETIYSRVKPDVPRICNGDPVKYESPVGAPNQLYIPQRTFAVLGDPTVMLLITEGEKKALAADQHGFPCLGLVGVYGWSTKAGSRLLPALERIPMRGREVVIVFDSDVATNEKVQAAEAELAARLQQREAGVRVARLPAEASA